MPAAARATLPPSLLPTIAVCGHHPHSPHHHHRWCRFNLSVTQTYPQRCTNDVGCEGATHYANPTAPIQIVTGAAGCNEGLHACMNPIKRSRGPWSAFWLQAAGTYRCETNTSGCLGPQ